VSRVAVRGYARGLVGRRPALCGAPVTRQRRDHCRRAGLYGAEGSDKPRPRRSTAPAARQLPHPPPPIAAPAAPRRRQPRRGRVPVSAGRGPQEGARSRLAAAAAGACRAVLCASPVRPAAQQSLMPPPPRLPPPLQCVRRLSATPRISLAAALQACRTETGARAIPCPVPFDHGGTRSSRRPPAARAPARAAAARGAGLARAPPRCKVGRF
jgi:hypothetical protein